VIGTVNQPGESPSGVMTALVLCRGNVCCHVDQMAAVGWKYDAPESYTATHRLKTLICQRVACSEWTCHCVGRYCVCSDIILD
jgi:hypothetical protein